MEDAIKKCKEKYNTKIFAVITDNKNKMCIYIIKIQILKEK